MYFEILTQITNRETIATGKSIRELKRLERTYGKGRWRKLKGIAKVKLKDGKLCLAEIHWYEAQGIGKNILLRNYRFFLKRLIDDQK
ncbi:hypothetical protein JCM12298_16870 [Desulfothermus naphthae]